ncbi:MAG: nuclear transport factor 2 family protein [Aquabacterium sp.]
MSSSGSSPIEPSLPGLYVLAGLAGTRAQAVPPPDAEVSALQLRALNHRSIQLARPAQAALASDTALLKALVHEDFLFTRADGAWLARDAFIDHQGRLRAAPAAVFQEMVVRLFGPVALVHGVFANDAQAVGAQRVRFTDTHVWSGTGWQLVGAQDTAMADAVPAALIKGQAPAYATWLGRDPEGDDQAVLHVLNDLYVKAFRDADVDWYGAHLAPEYVVVSSDGSFRDRAGALANFALPSFATHYQHFPVDRVRVRRFADVALIHAANAYVRKDGRTGESRYTDIWVKQDGRWVCVAAHITAHAAVMTGDSG